MSNDHKPLSAAEIEDLRELEAKATPGPWAADATEPDDVVLWGPPEKEGAEKLVANVGAERITQVGVAFDIDAHNAALVAAMRNALPRLLSMLQPPTDIPGAVDEAKAWMDASWASRLYPSAVRDCWETLVRAHTDLERELKMAASNRQEWMVACLEKQSELAALKPGPTDAAVREAVERIWAEIGELPQYGCRDCGLHAEDVHTLLSYVRAVQSPRLTSEQVEAVLDAETVLDMLCDGKSKTSEVLRSAFPGVFGKEG